MLADNALQRLERVGHENKKKYVTKRARLQAVNRAKIKKSNKRKRRYYQRNRFAKTYSQSEADAGLVMYVNGPIRFRRNVSDKAERYFETMGRVIYNQFG